MIGRKLTLSLKKAASQYPVVTLTGPRESGKTTLVQAAFSRHDYVSLEDPEQRSLALDDPRSFLDQFSRPVIFDEAQRAPELFSYIQTIVDAENRPGRFILTGSQNFLLVRTISQTLAGRCAIHHLLPFSLSELSGWPDLDVDQIGRRIPTARNQPAQEPFETLFTGFYPRIHDMKLDPQDWLKNYTQTYLQRDVRDLINVGDLETFRRFMALCAGRCGQLLNLVSLGADCGITHTTARRWLSVLEASFIVTLLRPHHQNFNKRLIKSPKLYFLDTGLLCYLLKIRKPEDLRFHGYRGSIFENYVIAEFYKKALHAGKEADLFFWRDSSGHEIDLILDEGEKAIPVEIKSGQTVAKDFFKGIDYYRKISGDGSMPAALIYAGNRSYKHGDTAVYSWWNF